MAALEDSTLTEGVLVILQSIVELVLLVIGLDILLRIVDPLLIGQLGQLWASHVLHGRHFAELLVRDLSGGIVVTPSQNGLDILPLRIEAVCLEIRGKRGDADGLLSLSDGVEGLQLDEVRAIGQLTRCFTASPLEKHLFVEQARCERHHLVRDSVISAEVRRKTALHGDVSQIWVRCGQYKLAEFVEV